VIRIIFFILIVCLAASPSMAQWSGQVPPSDVPVYVPDEYDPDVAMPLLVFLHGYAPLTTVWYDILIPLQGDANARGYIYVKPDGSQDGLGEFYWNATDACCDMWGNDPDHVGYLTALLDSIESNYNIDPRRIHLIGHSNGGFMCHRMACEASERLASVVSISGAMWNDEAVCQPTDPVHVLQIHGTLDPVILWFGGYIGFTPYPGANTTAEYWVAHNGCSATATNGGSFDMDGVVLFDETTRWIYEQCADPTAGSSELWEVFGATHFPAFSDEGIQVLFDYLDAHVRPPGTCLGDANDDQVVDVTDLLQVVGDWGSSLSEADVNGDGTVDVLDLLVVVGNWGSCP
jgi:polyhydroxybutyrate depolymerase